MSDPLKSWFDAAALTPPPDFATRIVAQAREIQQPRPMPPALRPWQWLSLGAGAGLGSLALAQFVFFAFLTAGAQ